MSEIIEAGATDGCSRFDELAMGEVLVVHVIRSTRDLSVGFVLCVNVNHTNTWRENTAVKINALQTRRPPLTLSWSRPNVAKS